MLFCFCFFLSGEFVYLLVARAAVSTPGPHASSFINSKVLFLFQNHRVTFWFILLTSMTLQQEHCTPGAGSEIALGKRISI